MAHYDYQMIRRPNAQYYYAVHFGVLLLPRLVGNLIK